MTTTLPTKVITLVRASDRLSAEEFEAYWRDDFFASMLRIPIVRDRLVKAVHNQVLPGEVRPDLPPSAHRWSGVGEYWFDDEDDARRLVADPALAEVIAEHRDAIEEVTHLLCSEVLIFDKGIPTSWKMMAFYKRLPNQTREESLHHYGGVHAEMARHPKNPMQRYVQNHALLDHQNPDERYDYDGGPEAWYGSEEAARGLFENPRAMAGAVEDEARFSVMDESIYFYLDESLVYLAPG